MNIQELTAYINQNVRNNGVQAITGDLMQNVLNSIVATLSDGANIVPGSVTRGAIAPGAVDNTPTAGSNNLITSAAVAVAIKAIQAIVADNKELTDTELQDIINTVSGLTDAVKDRIPISEKGMYNGVATLGEDGRVPASQLPGFVDDVKEGYLLGGVFYRDAEYTDAMEPQGDVIYIDLLTDKEYRWGGTKYAQISESLALGETAETAYSGSKGKQNANDIEALKTGKQNTLVSGENIKTINGESILGAGNLEISGGGGAEPISITWAELVALRDAGGLTVGAKYRITDYITAVNKTNILSAGYPFDIVVTAISNNLLSEDAKAMLHEGDTYFADTIKDWTLKYILDNDTTRYDWADTTNGKGVIYWLEDEKGVSAPYDFKNIKFRHTDGKLSSYGNYTFTFYNPSELSKDYSGVDRYYNIKMMSKPNKNLTLGIYLLVQCSDSTSDKTYNIDTLAVQSIIANSNNCKGSIIATQIKNSNYITSDNTDATCVIENCENIWVNLRKSTLRNVKKSLIYGTQSTLNNVERSLMFNFTNVNITASWTYNAVFISCSNIKLNSNSVENLYIGVASDNITIGGGTNINIGRMCTNVNISSKSKNITIGDNCTNIKGINDPKNVKIGNNCSDINFGFYNSATETAQTYIDGLVIGDNCNNLELYYFGQSDYSYGGDYRLDNVTIGNNVNYLTLASDNLTGENLANMTILDGGSETEPVQILAKDAQASGHKFATRNSAGEYKVFVLGDLAPA